MISTISVVTDHGLELVPSTKEDVFTNTTISLMDKRKLMRLMKGEQSSDGTFKNFVDAQNMAPWISDAMVYGVAMVQNEAGICILWSSLHSLQSPLHGEWRRLGGT